MQRCSTQEEFSQVTSICEITFGRADGGKQWFSEKAPRQP